MGTVPIRVSDRVGSFRYFRDEDRWEWSDAVAQMHGYAPGAVEPDDCAGDVAQTSR